MSTVSWDWDGNETAASPDLDAEIRRLTSENDALRAKCAEAIKLVPHDLFTHFEMRDGCPGSVTDHGDEYHPTPHPECRRCKLEKDNPGQALLDRLAKVEALAEKRGKALREIAKSKPREKPD